MRDESTDPGMYNFVRGSGAPFSTSWLSIGKCRNAARFVAEPPIAAEGDPVESRAGGAALGRQLHARERELHVAGDESRAPPLEVDRDVAVAGLRHDRRIWDEAADGGEIHVVRGR